MSCKSPIFPISDPLHFNDAQTDCFRQVFGEARKQNRRVTRSVGVHRCKMQKPISKEEFKKSKKRKWWRNAPRFLKWSPDQDPYYGFPASRRRVEPFYEAVSRPPVYGGEFLTAVAPCRSSGPPSGPLSGRLSPTEEGAPWDSTSQSQRAQWRPSKAVNFLVAHLLGYLVVHPVLFYSFLLRIN